MKVYSILVLILNIRLASLWPNIVKTWNQIDLVMDRRYGRLKNLNLRIKVLLALYFVSTLGKPTSTSLRLNQIEQNGFSWICRLIRNHWNHGHFTVQLLFIYF
jgi:hypothetical protein